MKFEEQASNWLNRKARLNILVKCIIHTPFNICHYKLLSGTSSPTALFETSVSFMLFFGSPIHFAVLFLSQPWFRSTMQNTNNV